MIIVLMIGQQKLTAPESGAAPQAEQDSTAPR
jgi:hypothetical protein